MLRLFLRLPPVGYFIIAALLLGAGYFLQNTENGIQAARADALAGDPPQAVALGDFDPADLGPAKEVNIAAQINNRYTYTLYKDNENDPNARVMWLLFDPAATGNERVVKSAIVVRERDAEKFTDWLIDNAAAIGEISPIFNINGQHSTNTAYDDIAEDAIGDERLTRDPDFFYIQPFFDGRVAGLAPRSTSDGGLFYIATIAALIVASFGVVKMLWRRRGRAAA
ncbi:hypothetical protein ACJ5NV_18770 [Loktanella agnita]|uniref:hypothetical protein n=1 Tax=Loktanella agnita TaxID=287097 RepID=UPI0039891151